MGKFQTGLIHVKVNTISGKEDMTKKKVLEDACHDENRRKLSQASNTLLIHGRISQEIGLDSTPNSCVNIMQGNYNTPPYTDE